MFEANHWIEYVPGDAPLIIIAPHGGSIKPRNLRTRKCEGCQGGIDTHTQELARAVVDSFVAHTGHRPHLVVNLLHRSKFDANREMTVATGEHVELESTWYWLHAAIDSAKASVIRQAGRGLVIDLHGHAHKIDRIEVGYLLGPGALQRIDDGPGAAASLVASSISSIARTSAAGDSYGAMHSGPNSLGGMLAAAGLRAVPSPDEPAPRDGEEYWTGAYNTERHGSSRGGVIDAAQLEVPVDAIGDKPQDVQRVAGKIAVALARFLERQYAWK
jgi:hypothetical protein